MVVITARHVELWSKAHPLTKPGKSEKPPTYGAWHRQRNGKRELVVEPVEAEQEIEGLTVR